MNEVAGRRFEQLIAWRLGVRVTKYMLIILKPSQRIIRGQLMRNVIILFNTVLMLAPNQNVAAKHCFLSFDQTKGFCDASHQDLVFPCLMSMDVSENASRGIQGKCKIQYFPGITDLGTVAN